MAVYRAIYYENTSNITTMIYPYMILIMSTLITWITEMIRMNEINIFTARGWGMSFR